MKSLLAIISSILIALLSIKRLTEANSTGDILVGGSLTLLAIIFCLYLIFERSIKTIVFRFGFNSLLFHYAVIILLLFFLEIFLLFVPIEGEIYGILRIILMSFFLAGIIILFVLAYREKKKGI
ncbi:MAG: hypothetical protein M0036_26560 [Desulfobacteraceae bacterium]|nr:hypothetical protein [Desulfobacteraceae bacterium]